MGTFRKKSHDEKSMHNPLVGVDNGIILRVQAAGVAVFALLLAAQFAAGVDGVDGWWIVPAPFLPALLWNYYSAEDSHKVKAE
jgi:hypothetical protein